MVRFLVTTGTSKTGSATISALRSLGENDIVAGTRNVEKNQEYLKSIGASSVVHFDHDDEASIEKAMEGVDAVYVSLGNVLDIAPVYSRVEKIASKHSVKTIAGIGAIISPDSSVYELYNSAEAVILNSKLQSFVVAPSWFFENWKISPIIEQLQSGTVYTASGEGLVGYISAKDIGAVSAHALINPSKYNKQRLVITGPKAISESQIVSEIAKTVLQKDIAYVSLPIPDFKAALVNLQYPGFVVDFFAELESLKLSGSASVVTNTVADVTGKEPISLEEWAAEWAKELKGKPTQ